MEEKKKMKSGLEGLNREELLNEIFARIKGRTLFPERVAEAKKLISDPRFIAQFKALVHKRK